MLTPEHLLEIFKHKSLYLSDRSTKKIPPELGQLSNFWELSLHNHELAQLSFSFQNLHHLEILNVDNNQLTSVPPDIIKAQKLYTLYLYKNQLKSVPGTFSQLPQLRRLYLQNNPLAESEKERIQQLLSECKISF
ncbi:hypothetical protein BKI52_44695 [marine bacterium AO1-C]|nr:hypothetical protein BKI52_44695 [marine bacterium AO1-C]